MIMQNKFPSDDWMQSIPKVVQPPEIHVQALLVLAQKHLDRQKYKEAFDFFEKAARSRHPQALNMLGRAYERGWGCARNASRAAELFEKSAAAGEPWALFNLADLILRGEAPFQDTHRALCLYILAAQRGVGKALNMIGVIYERGLTGRQDPSYALKFFEGGAQSGDGWSALNAARLLIDQGQRARALNYLAKALDLGPEDVVQSVYGFVAALPDSEACMHLLPTRRVKDIAG